MNDNLKETAEFFKALSDHTRLKIISLLLSNKGELCVGAIANLVGITQPATSQHLKILKNMHLVEDTRLGYNIHYKIKREAFEKYKIFFDQIIDETHSDQNLDCKNNDNCK